MIIFDDYFDKEPVKEFIESLEQKISLLEEGEILDVFYTTNGGSVAFGFIMRDILLKYKDKIKLCLIDVMNSSGFDLLWHLKDMTIYMYPSFRYAMTHKASNTLSTSSQAFDIEMNQLKDDTLIWNQRLRDLGISEHDINKFNSNDNIFIPREEVLKLFPNIIEVQ